MNTYIKRGEGGPPSRQHYPLSTCRSGAMGDQCVHFRRRINSLRPTEQTGTVHKNYSQELPGVAVACQSGAR
jgi:hypothetical protein